MKSGNKNKTSKILVTVPFFFGTWYLARKNTLDGNLRAGYAYKFIVFPFRVIQYQSS